MLFRNDVFIDADNRRYRLLAVVAPQDQAWIIGLDNPHAWPEARRWSFLVNKQSVDINGIQEVYLADPKPTQLARSQRAFSAIAPLLAAGTAIYNPIDRSRLVKEQTAISGVSDKTLRQYLREYWQGGQNQSALLGSWHNCGRSQPQNQTARRGRRPTHSSYNIFEVDEAIRAALEPAHRSAAFHYRHYFVSGYHRVSSPI